jgi:hypothetical protein
MICALHQSKDVLAFVTKRIMQVVTEQYDTTWNKQWSGYLRLTGADMPKGENKGDVTIIRSLLKSLDVVKQISAAVLRFLSSPAISDNTRSLFHLRYNHATDITPIASFVNVYRAHKLHGMSPHIDNSGSSSNRVRHHFPFHPITPIDSAFILL